MDKKLFAIIIGIWVWTNAQAYDFRVWGVCFNLHGNDEVSVTTDKEPYSGFVNIPDSIDEELPFNAGNYITPLIISTNL